MKPLLHALAFLTIAPLRFSERLEPEDFGRLPGYYPLVGLFLGLAAAVLAWVAYLAAAPAGFAATALAACQIIFTRGFHLDGLADAADALLSHRSLEKKFEILKDSRQGAFGVTAIVLDLLLKTSLLAALAPDGRFLTAPLILYPVWGRLTASIVAVRSDSARPESGGLGCWMIQLSGPRELFLALASTLTLSACGGWAALAAALAAACLGLLLTPVWRR
ncbi:MAG: adenosylcobinamide-GDP ribazoletransferase, partial [Deltaproteobacteria bacterium]|nr:adenosylcobinamide-GDP ribazoletransferase [Deltaproteobacteria bacterium]